MKKIFNIAKVVVLKTIAMILWAALAIFNVAVKVFTFFFRVAAVPIIFFGLLITAGMYFNDGFSPVLLHAVGFFAVTGALYFVLPYFPDVICFTQLRVKNYALSPIVVRSPVKFTL